jgi:hypothetical protein
LALFDRLEPNTGDSDQIGAARVGLIDRIQPVAADSAVDQPTTLFTGRVCAGPTGHCSAFRNRGPIPIVPHDVEAKPTDALL